MSQINRLKFKIEGHILKDGRLFYVAGLLCNILKSVQY